jgi:Ca2+-binding RTX toxin-like protein
MTGSGGADIITGGADSDTVHGSPGNDTVTGDTGDATLHGEAGNDNLNGGLGDDTLHGDAGNDTLTALTTTEASIWSMAGRHLRHTDDPAARVVGFGGQYG